MSPLTFIKWKPEIDSVKALFDKER